MPREKLLSFVVVARIVGKEIVNTDLKFNFHINDVCVDDVLQWTQPIASNLNYIISSPSVAQTAKSVYTSKYPLCPKNCVLTDGAGQFLDASNIGVTFTQIEFGGQMQVKTDNFKLNY